eukprot:jgi/Undpi1/6239/HiC_scaffold_20.g08723.m1
MEAIDTVTAAAAAAEATSSGKKEVLDAIHDKVLDYYNQEHVFDFYEQVSGGEDIHVGLQSMLKGEDAKLQGVARISKASYITTTELLNRCFPSEGSFDPSKSTVLDMGSGFGGTARVAAKELGCKAAGLEDKVTIPGEKSYFETGMPDSSCEVVCSLDALLHGGSERHRALAEAARILKPGGRMVFTDIMRSDDATPKDLEQVYKRDCISDLGSDLGSVKYYKKWGKEFGLEFVDYMDYTADMATHYALHEGKHDAFIDHATEGVDTWVSGARSGVIRWGFMVFKNSVSIRY